METVPVDDRHPVGQVADALEVAHARLADEAIDLVPLLEEVLRQVGPILAGDPGDQRSLHRYLKYTEPPSLARWRDTLTLKLPKSRPEAVAVSLVGTRRPAAMRENR